MKPVVEELSAAVRDVARITFVAPVQEGRPRPGSWPRGLREIGVAALVVFALLALATLFAVPLRQSGDLSLSVNSANSQPMLTLPLLLVGVLLSLAMASTAALHASWWLRIALLLLAGSAVVFFSLRAWNNPLLLVVSAVSYLALVGFTFVRALRSYAWWEFVVVAVLLLCATLLPWAFPGDGVSWGIDLRPAIVDGALVTLQPLILPAVMVAGSAPAQIVVTGAQATASRPVSLHLFAAGFGLSVVWLAVATGQGLGTDQLSASAVAGAAVALLVTAGLVALWLWRARVPTPPQPQHYPEVWGAWLYPLAVAMSLLILVTFPLILLREVGIRLQQPALAGVFEWTLNLLLDNNPGVVARGVLGVIALAIAWRLSARSRLAEAVALTAFAVLVLLDLVGMAPALRFVQDRSTEAMGLIASGVALVVAVLALVRRRFDRATAVGVMTVVLLAVLYPHRNLLSDPLDFALAFSGAAVLVFGLAWRVFTEAQVTYSSSRRYPQSTRVLLFLANALFATTGIAYVTLGRGLGSDADPTLWGELGDTTLGDPLFLTGLVAGLWLVLRPDRSLQAEAPLETGLGPLQPDAGVRRPADS